MKKESLSINELDAIIVYLDLDNNKYLFGLANKNTFIRRLAAKSHNPNLKLSLYYILLYEDLHILDRQYHSPLKRLLSKELEFPPIYFSLADYI